MIEWKSSMFQIKPTRITIQDERKLTGKLKNEWVSIIHPSAESKQQAIRESWLQVSISASGMSFY